MELAREVDRAKRTQQPFTLAFVGVDNRKATNDSLGHAAEISCCATPATQSAHTFAPMT